MKNPDISFSLVTPAYNNPEEVKELLQSVEPEASKDPSLEVIVVDDCSKGDAIGKVTREYPFTKYVRLEKNSGPAVARNVGAKLAKNDILLFLDSDVMLNEETMSRIRDKFNTNKPIEVFGGEYDIEPANPSLSTKFKALMVHSWIPKEEFVTVFLTRFGAIKKDIFEKMGGFDTSLKTASVEDYEIGRRLMDRGYTIHYDPSVTVKHHFPSFRKQIKLFFHRSFMWIYAFKKCRKFDNTCTTPLLAISQICGVLSMLFLIPAFININFIYASIAFFFLFILTNGRFFKLTLKYGGPTFFLISIPMALIIAFSIVIGGLWGVIYYFLYNGTVRKK